MDQLWPCFWTFPIVVVDSNTVLMSDEPNSDASSPVAEKVLPEDTQLIGLFQPVLYGLEEQVHRVATAQVELRTELDALLNSLRDIKQNVEQDSLVTQLEEKSKKLIAFKRRLTLVHTILQNSNERCRKMMINYKVSLPTQPQS